MYLLFVLLALKTSNLLFVVSLRGRRTRQSSFTNAMAKAAASQ
ncbi:MAG: hypothetical protein ACI9C9_001313 [Marivirga sp.]